MFNVSCPVALTVVKLPASGVLAPMMTLLIWLPPPEIMPVTVVGPSVPIVLVVYAIISIRSLITAAVVSVIEVPFDLVH